MSDNQATSVEILGREYRIRSAADAAYIREVARYVDAKLREVAPGASSQAPDRVAILAAMNIADELFQLRRASTEEISSIERRTQSLIRMLDEELASATGEAVASRPK
ncbi:MAG TPA: cell division protein ZapA [Candidatus Krumholzibacteria bacterium]|nr:cell division protein ZapA [Candidatus Krumholzibacteria bacterium]